MKEKFNSAQISLYSIDCIRKILQIFSNQQSKIFYLLDKARLAEINDDETFWNKSYEVLEEFLQIKNK